MTQAPIDRLTDPAPAAQRNQVLVTADELRALLAEPRAANAPIVLDVRWELPTSLDPFDGRDPYQAGHIPGAVYVDLDTELAEPPSAHGGRHPLPTLDRLQSAARRWGLTENRAVVVYDDIGGMGAARAWWLLRDCGLPVRILDGGLSAWIDDGGELETGEVIPAPTAISLRPGQAKQVDVGQVAAFPSAGILLDARGGARYRGEFEPLDPRPGHIPGARSAPAGHDLDATGRFLPDSELVARFARHGIVPGGAEVAVYCGSGVTAAHEIAALAVIGVDAALYPGSYSQWANNPELPVATGPD